MVGELQPKEPVFDDKSLGWRATTKATVFGDNALSLASYNQKKHRSMTRLWVGELQRKRRYLMTTLNGWRATTKKKKVFDDKALGW